MAKNKNKGFSLIEIIIAISVLTLLLTPILKQLAATMSTNRKAKEQQYAVENAEYVLQYVQSTGIDDIGDTSVTTGDVYCVSKKISDGDTVAGNEEKHECTIYTLGLDASGNVSAVATSETIEYSTFEYELNPVELGYRNTEYSRKVILDDISNRVKTLEYESPDDTDGDGKKDIYNYFISYDNPTAVDGFTLTTEGSMVQYDAEGYVSAIVCEMARGTSSADPNQLNMGNMHNFDYTQMALINGYTTDYDEQAADDFYAEAMEILKNSTDTADRQSWQAAISGGAQLDTSKYLAGMRKLTTISILDNKAEKCYEVKVTVVYENTIGGVLIQKSYESVYGQKFPYEVKEHLDGSKTILTDPPEVYFEYQPISTGFVDKPEGEYAEYSITYAKDEYILIDNQVKDAKIYLVKPKWDQARIFTHEITDLTSIANENTPEAEDVYYYISNGTPGAGVGEQLRTNNTKVNINIASVNEVKADNKFTIYTNLIVEDSVDSDTTDVTNPQFTLNNPGVYKDSGYKYFGIPSESATGAVTYAQRTAFSVPADCLKSMADEDTKGNRLYTVTVTLTPDSDGLNTVIFTGAKGAN